MFSDELVEKVGTRAKTGMTGRTGRTRRGEKEKLACKPHDFEQLRLPTNIASDWCGAVSVD